MANIIKYNKTSSRWELIDSTGAVYDYAVGSANDNPFNLSWGRITISVGGSVNTTATPDKILSGVTAVSHRSRIVGTMPNWGDVTVTPEDTDQTYDPGYYEYVKVKGDPNLTPENIVKGISIFGVAGEHECESVDTPDFSQVTASREDVRIERTFIDSEGNVVSGTMPNAEVHAMHGGTAQQWRITAGYISDMTISADPPSSDGGVDFSNITLTPELASEGYDFLDSTGNMVTGTAINFIDQGLMIPVEGTLNSIAYGGEGMTSSDILIQIKLPLPTSTAIINNGTWVAAFGVEGLIPGNIKKGITIGGLTGTYEGTSADFSQVTAEPRYVMSMLTFFDNNGNPVEGRAENCTSDSAIGDMSASFSGLSVERENGADVGYIVLTTDKIYDTAIIDKGTRISAIIPGLIPENIKSGVVIGGITGSYAGDGDTSGDSTGGAPGEGSGEFYLATELDGVLTEIIVYAGKSTDDVGEPYSLQGTYKIVDPGAKGTARRWYCAATTEDGDYMSTRVTLGYGQHEMGFDDNGDIKFEGRWGFYPQGPTDELQEYYCMAMATTGGQQSPFDVTDWEGAGMCGVVDAPEMTSAVPDSEPYGPSNWIGRKMVWGTGRNFYGTKNASRSVVNGLWYREDEGQELSQNTVFYNYNGKAKIYIPPSGNEYLGWSFVVVDKALFGDNKWHEIYGFSGNAFTADAIPHPFTSNKWSVVDSNYKPLPEFVIATSGYYPEDTETSGLTIAGSAPEIGKIYNANATIEAGSLYPA